MCVTESKKPTHTAMAVMVNVNCLLWVGDVDVRTSVLTEKFYKFIRVYLSQTEDMPGSKTEKMLTENMLWRVAVLQFFLCIWNEEGI